MRRPNILWIVTTQWRGRALGLAGDPNARTPTLDAWARTARVYTQAVTPHPFGPFARAALLTGRPSPENGVRDYFDPLPRESRTIAHELHDRGYTSGFFGKWHLGRRDPRAPLVGEAHARALVPAAERGGFDFWEGFESGFLINDPWLHGTELPEPVRFPGYQSEVLVERFLRWKRGAGPDPWFALLSLEPPHPPYSSPAAGIVPRDPGEIQLPPNVPRGGEVEAQARRELAGYHAHIEATDRALAGLFHGIDLANTLVVFTSAHGDMHGAHGRFRKGWPWEESIHVPLLVSGPGIPPGRTPRIVSLLHVSRATRSWIEGSGEPFPEGPARISMPSVVRLPHQGDRRWRGVRTDDAMLALGETDEPWLLYDLRRDPWQLRNLVRDPACASWRDGLRALC